MRECEESGGDKAIAEEHWDGEDGEIEELHIFCAKCLDPESYEVGASVLPACLPFEYCIYVIYTQQAKTYVY